MRAIVVPAKSVLIGESCLCCPRKIREREVVFHQRLRGCYGKDRVVFHVACIAAAAERAPVGRPPGEPVAQVTEMRRRIARTGQRWPDRDPQRSATAQRLRELASR